MSRARVEVTVFERVAFESVLREHPADMNAAAAYRDWLQDQGYTPMGAKRIVLGVIREATEARTITTCRLSWMANGAWKHELDTMLRRGCRVNDWEGFYVVFRPGGMVPFSRYVAVDERSDLKALKSNQVAEGPPIGGGAIAMWERLIEVGVNWVTHRFPFKEYPSWSE